ncbi:jg27363 [Pararge aegeria aegeria]|uniref:Jg27363 protein n=1 Tax=Pararge aegeria aegeria TaxID=348720 RepID=A0A8S4QDW7_9NEOP|nr:jg27363 [Pararge aegeria aegeria]
MDRAELNHPDIPMIGNCEVVQSYVYLGSTTTNTGGFEEDIQRRNMDSSLERPSQNRCTRNVVLAATIVGSLGQLF